jgi:beta-RFAP synthase
VVTIAGALNRGRRSAIGTHGFALGGLLVDSGKSAEEVVAPLAVRTNMPQAWRVLLLLPAADRGLSGDAEERAFATLPAVGAATTSLLRRIALDEIGPAARAEDLPRFAEAVARFNELSGNCFAPVQGGAYSSPNATRWIDRLRQLGAPAGQSSWGPTLFAFAADQADAEQLAKSIVHDARGDGFELRITPPLNRGASIEIV